MQLPWNDSPRFAALTIRTECYRCGGNVPVDNPNADLKCPDCATALPAPAAIMRDLVTDFESKWPNLKPEQVIGSTVTDGALTWKGTVRVANGGCPSCGDPLVDALETPGPCACPACQRAVHVERGPSFLSRPRTVKAVIDVASAAPITAQSTATARLDCPSCGGGLTLSATDPRVTTCRFCTNSVAIPESIWRTLHPVRVSREWIVAFDGPSPAATKWYADIAKAKEAAEKAREAAAKADRRREAADAKRAQQRAEDARRAEERALAQAERHRELATWQKWASLAWGASLIATIAATFTTALGWGWAAFGDPVALQSMGIPYFIVMRMVLIISVPVVAMTALATGLGFVNLFWASARPIGVIGAAWEVLVITLFSGFPVLGLLVVTPVSALRGIGGSLDRIALTTSDEEDEEIRKQGIKLGFVRRFPHSVAVVLHGVSLQLVWVDVLHVPVRAYAVGALRFITSPLWAALGY